MKNEVTAEMIKAIELATENGGEIVRHNGGFWAGRNWHPKQEWVGVATIRALVSRNRMVFTEYRASTLPVKAKLI